MSSNSLRQEIDALRDAEWTTWPHAYGSARDTPGHLTALLGDDETAQAGAARHYGSAIVHQSTIWPASPDAFAWLIRVLRDRALPADVLRRCLSALAEAGEHVDDSDARELPAPGRAWLTRFATTSDEDHDLLWEDFLGSDAEADVHLWVVARMAALRPAVAALVAELDDGNPETADAVNDVRRAWLP
jgi:hypothetical protein